MAAGDVEEVIIPFGNLEIGEMYCINSAIEEQRFIDGKYVRSVKLDVSKSDSLKTFTYVPKTGLNYAVGIVNAINQAVIEKTPYKVCYYGCVTVRGTNGNVTHRAIHRIHKFEDKLNTCLLKDVEDMNKRCCAYFGI